MLFALALVLSLPIAGLLFPQQVSAADFHVTTAADFQAALDAAENNGQDDTIYLAAGTYQGNFKYLPPDTEHKSLTITGEPGTTAADIIVDGQNIGRVLNLYDWSNGTVAEITVNGITVQNGNSARNGGGIYAALAFYNISITNCIIRNSTAARYGGGIDMDTHENLTLENNLILDNTVTEDTEGISRGGGVAISTPFGNYTIRNNIIAGNTAQGTTDSQGGGLWVGWSLSANFIHLIGNTIYNNEANKGGGVYFYLANTANVYNNIIYGNTAADGGDIYFQTVTNRKGYNNDYSSMSGSWTESGNNINLDPAFVDPASDDYHLSGGSPCIDAGTTAVPDPPGLPATDFEGDSRVSGAAPDIGADEYVALTYVITFDTNPANTGTITFDGVDYSDGDTVSVGAGGYSIVAHAGSGYVFSEWQVEDDISVANPGSATTTCIVSGDGTLRMVQREVTPPPTGVGGEVYPPNKLAILAPWIALFAAVIAGAAILVRRRRAQG